MSANRLDQPILRQRVVMLEREPEASKPGTPPRVFRQAGVGVKNGSPLTDLPFSEPH